MTGLINTISDDQIRKHVKKAEQQGFRLGRRTARGLSVLGRDDDPEKRGRIVTVVPTSKGQNGTVGNVLAELKRAGYDPDWEPPKHTTAYTPDRVAEISRRMEVQAELDAAQDEPIPWLVGPKLQRVVTYCMCHPDLRFTLRYLAEVCEVDEGTVLHNGTNIRRRDPHMVYHKGWLMWDSQCIPDEMYRAERMEAEQRATDEYYPFPVFLTGEVWHYDEFGRLNMKDITGKTWVAVPRYVKD